MKDTTGTFWPGLGVTDLPQLGLQVRVQSLDAAHQIRYVSF